MLRWRSSGTCVHPYKYMALYYNQTFLVIPPNIISFVTTQLYAFLFELQTLESWVGPGNLTLHLTKIAICEDLNC